MSDSRNLLSVGIDIGTTTTQVVFSRLSLQDISQIGQIPRVDITRREVVYRSPIVFTPLKDFETIDAAQLNEIVRREYTSAGVNAKEVETGAVIITGETAKKKNADEILQALAGLAGEFVISVAGPNVESLIAGKGAGAAEYSQKHYVTVMNIDIGGGSANSSVFRNGKLIGAAAMNYGGRILELENGSGKIRHIAEPAKHILADLGLGLKVGDIPSLDTLRRFTDRMANLTVELIKGASSSLAQRVYLTPPFGISDKNITLMFSGGVGHYYYNPISIHSINDMTIHGDVGPLLAESLRTHPALNAYTIVPPLETSRATVLGASTQTVTLSGSTIWVDDGILPLKNVPVIRPTLPATLEPVSVSKCIAEAATRWDINPNIDLFAVALNLDKPLDYQALTQLANGLIDFTNTIQTNQPLLIITERDYARVLGQTIKGFDSSCPLLVIDQVGLSEGDYIDIGSPLMDGRVVPLSVKTLIFYH